MGIHLFTRSEGHLRALPSDDNAADDRRRLLRAPVLLRSRLDGPTRTRLSWSGRTAAHIRVLGVAPAVVTDEEGEPASRILPGRDYTLTVGAVQTTGELLLQVGDAEPGDSDPFIHRLTLVAARPEREAVGLATVVDLAAWSATGNLSLAEDRR